MVSNITENNISLAILMIAEMNENGIVTFEELRERVPVLFELSESDLEINPIRPNECRWEQRIRNVVSNVKNRGNIFREGYVEHVRDTGFKITRKGRKFLEDKHRSIKITARGQ